MKAKIIAIWHILTHKCFYVATCKTGGKDDIMNQQCFMTKGMANTIAHHLYEMVTMDEIQEEALNEAMNILNKVQ